LTKIQLRTVLASDLPVFFEQQLDPQAIEMAAYPSKDRGPFMLHWEQNMKNRDVTLRTIVYKGKVAGHILSWKEKYEYKVGYWLGREFWGRGIASSALAEFVKEVTIRPLYAHVSNHNIVSKRVLEKCGFVIHDDGKKESVYLLSG
jgi:RimJ/RimL family protein N-acetyltransferase